MTSRRFVFSCMLCGIALCCTGTVATAQLNSYIQAVRPFSAREGEPLIVSAALTQSSSITRIVLSYRQLGVTEFHSVEMQMSRDSATVTVPAAEIAPPFLEFYVTAELQSGRKETYPVAAAQSSPARITILPRSEKDAEILILSPDANEAVKPGELYISLSFVYAPDAVEKRRTRIILNTMDLSSRALITGDLIILPSAMIPEDLKRGDCALTVQVFDTAGAVYHTLHRSFSIAQQPDAASAPIPFYVNGSAQAESRSEDIKGASKVYNRFDVRANSRYGILKTTANLQLTSEERPENQPQNRYFLGLDAQYVKLGFGDTYPQFPTTLMDGRRVRGVSAYAGYGGVQVTAATGEIVRGVDTDTLMQTHRRTLTAVRPSFGKGDNFQWGFSYIHSKDEWNAFTTVKPRENIVAGTDLYAAIDDHRIEWTSQASMSVSNMDISTPAFTSDSIDAAVARGSLKPADGKDLKALLPIVSKLITFNENISPLNPSGLSSLACETALSFNYFNNYLKGTYTFHGNEYMSFGTTSFRNDIQGYNITDRLRLLGNSLFITGTVERLNNNVLQYEPTTTTWVNTTVSVSYFGIRHMPDLTVGFSTNNIANDAPANDSVVNTYPVVDYATRRYFVQSSYGFDWLGRHSAQVSLDYTNANDRSPRNQDVTGFNGMLFITSLHSASLESTFGFTTSINTLPAAANSMPEDDTAGIGGGATATLNYSTLMLGMGYTFMNDRMKATATLSPTFGDVRRTQLEGRVQFVVYPRHVVSAQYHYIVNSSIAPTPLMPHVNDSAFTIAYRMDL